jgi:hypothetical protein
MEGGHSAKQSFHQPYRDYERNRAEHYAALGFVRSAPKAIANIRCLAIGWSIAGFLQIHSLLSVSMFASRAMTQFPPLCFRRMVKV